MDSVRADKLREVQDGHDGTWVAHPALIPIAKEVRATGGVLAAWAVCELYVVRAVELGPHPSSRRSWQPPR
jgi:hypothetical protein